MTRSTTTKDKPNVTVEGTLAEGDEEHDDEDEPKVTVAWTLAEASAASRVGSRICVV